MTVVSINQHNEVEHWTLDSRYQGQNGKANQLELKMQFT